MSFETSFARRVVKSTSKSAISRTVIEIVGSGKRRRTTSWITNERSYLLQLADRPTTFNSRIALMSMV